MALTRISGIGAANDYTFSADQIVNKNLMAAMDVPVYNSARDDAKPLFYFHSGQSVGRVYSWIDVDPTQGRNELWWMFEAPTGASYGDAGGFYFIPHRSGYFDIQNLVDQGALTVAQATALEQAAKPTLMTYISKYLPWVLITAAIVAIGKTYLNKKL